MKEKQITFATYYWVSWVAVLVIGFSLTLVSNLLHPLTAVVGVLLCVWIILSQAFYRFRSLSPHFIYLLIFALIAWIEGGFFFVKSHDFIPMVAAVLVGLLPYFLSRRQKAFGVWIAFLCISLLALMSVIVASYLSEYALFLLFLISIIFNLNAANLLNTAGMTRAAVLCLPKGYFPQFGPSIFWGLFMAVLIFLFFPRSPTINNPFGFREKGVSTGYSGSLQLKTQSDLNISSAIAMTVESPDTKWLETKGEDLYFRGNSVDFFDGQAWINSSFETLEMNEETDLRYNINYDLYPKRLKIFREPHNTKAVLYPNVLLEITAPMTLIGGLHYDGNRNLTRGHNEVIRYSYEVLVSEPILPDTFKTVPLQRVIDVLRDPSLPHPLASMPDYKSMGKYLRLPFPNGSENYFTHWVEEIGIDPKTVSLSKAIDILRTHFSRKFQYTVNYKLNGDNAFEAFISKDRKGHCEYFATAAALYFRSLGIPSRVVLGYHGGTFNRISKTLEVREANAHAWVESYFPGAGWISFDTTPYAVQEQLTRFDAYMTLYIGAARFWANRYLVNYNNMTQRNLMKSLVGKGGSVWWKFAFPKEWQPYFKEIVFSGVFLFSLFWIWRMRRRNSVKTNLPQYYSEFLEKIATKGLVRSPGETFSKFHDRVRSANLDTTFLNEIDLTLERDLYSSKQSSESQRRILLKKLKTIRIS